MSEQSSAEQEQKGSTAEGHFAGKWIITRMNIGFICLKRASVSTITPQIGGSFVTKMEQRCIPFCLRRQVVGRLVRIIEDSDTFKQDALALIV